MMTTTHKWSAAEERDKVRQGAQAAGKLQEVCLEQRARKVVKIGKDLDDMDGIPTRFVQHSLNVDIKVKPIKQKRRLQSSKHQMVIKEEVTKLLYNGVIREVQFPQWLGNMVLVRKPNETW